MLLFISKTKEGVNYFDLLLKIKKYAFSTIKGDCQVRRSLLYINNLAFLYQDRLTYSNDHSVGLDNNEL